MHAVGRHLHGVFAAFKPRGRTSFSVVDELRSKLGGRRNVKMGHGGTLDPLADGVLVVGLNRGCKRLQSYLHGTKTYVGTGLLGQETLTQDAEGEVVAESSYSNITQTDIEGILPGFEGEIEQIAPAFSALKHRGRRLCDLAREGKPTPLKKRMVYITSIRCTRFEPPEFDIEVECGGGTYIRTIINDIGRQLGTHAHLTSLTRTRHGPFTLDRALMPEDWSATNIMREIMLSGDVREMEHIFTPEEAQVLQFSPMDESRRFFVSSAAPFGA